MSRPRQVSDEDILSAARKCFLEHGGSVSTSVIAKSLGISQPALFRRFGTKEKLMIEALLPKPSEWPDELNIPATVDLEIRAQLITLGDVLMSFFDRIVAAIVILKHSGYQCLEVDNEEKPLPLQFQEKVTEWFSGAMRKGLIEESNAEIVAMAFLGGLRTYSFTRHFTGKAFSISKKDYIEEVIDLLLRGIKVRSISTSHTKNKGLLK